MIDLKPDFTKISLDSWEHRVIRQNELRVDVLRLDKIHSDISGNKWFKLKYFLETATLTNKRTLVSFGGSYSNHLLALAATARIYGFNSIGLIRGEQPVILSHTLIAAKEYGMKLIFLPRTVFDQKKRSDFFDDWAENFTDLKIEAIRDWSPDTRGRRWHGRYTGIRRNFVSCATTRIYTYMHGCGNRYHIGRPHQQFTSGFENNRGIRFERYPGFATHRRFLDKGQVQNSQGSDSSSLSFWGVCKAQCIINRIYECDICRIRHSHRFCIYRKIAFCRYKYGGNEIIPAG